MMRATLLTLALWLAASFAGIAIGGAIPLKPLARKAPFDLRHYLPDHERHGF